MTVIVDEVMLREPNLLVPGKKPVGPVKIDWSHSLTDGLLSFGLDRRDIAQKVIGNYNGGTPEVQADTAGQFIHFNDTRNEECILLPHLKGKLDGIAEFTYMIRLSFHGTASSDEDSLGLQWNVLQGSADNNAKRILLRYDSNNEEIDLLCANNSGEVIHVKSATLDLNISIITGRLRNGVLETFKDGLSLGAGSSFTGPINNTSTTKYPEVPGGLKTSLSPGLDSPRVNLYSWGLWTKGLTDSEVAALSSDPYVFLMPA